MALITWGPRLELGIDIIDTQHKRWVSMVNELDDAMKKGEGREVLAKTLKGLVNYTHTHFGTEEELLTENDYDDLAQHKKEHRVFTDQVEMFQDRFNAGAMSLDAEVMNYLRDWLVTHITRTDRQYRTTLLEAGVR